MHTCLTVSIRSRLPLSICGDLYMNARSLIGSKMLNTRAEQPFYLLDKFVLNYFYGPIRERNLWVASRGGFPRDCIYIYILLLSAHRRKLPGGFFLFGRYFSEIHLI